MKSIFLLFILLAASASAETTDILIQKLTDTVRIELNEPAKKKDEHRNNAFYLLESMVEIKVNYAAGTVRRGAGEQFIAALGKLETTSTSPVAQELCQTINKQVSAEIAERQAATAKKIKAETAAAIHTALAAKTVRDFDGLLAAVDGGEINGKNPEQVALLAEARRAGELIRDLQDYVARPDREQFSSSKNRWDNILSLRTDFAIVLPRSELLAGLEDFRKRFSIPDNRRPMTQEEFENKGWEIVAETKSPEDLAGTAIRVVDWTHAEEARGLRTSKLSPLISLLNEYSRIPAATRSGAVGQNEIATLISRQREPHDATLRKLSNQLMMEALSRLLGTSEKAQGDEAPTAYVQRVASQAANTGDWLLLDHAVDILQVVSPNERHPIADRMAARSFLTGINQARAHQYALAVSFLQRALDSGSLLIPAEVIGERLEKIRKEHPEAFTDAESAPAQASGKNELPRAPRLFPDYLPTPLKGPIRLTEPSN